VAAAGVAGFWSVFWTGGGEFDGDWAAEGGADGGVGDPVCPESADEIRKTNRTDTSVLAMFEDLPFINECSAQCESEGAKRSAYFACASYHALQRWSANLYSRG
jgi:hypothetical protein